MDTSTQFDFRGLSLTGWVSFFVSMLVCFLIVASERWHVNVTADLPGSGPQKIHTTPIPRVGGVGIFVAFAIAMLATVAAEDIRASNTWRIGFLLALAMPFAFGLHEDITGRASPALRLLGTALAATTAFFMCDIGLVRFGVPGFDALLTFHWVAALLLSIFCVSAIAHAFNLVDGLNGLLGTMTLIASAGVAMVATVAGDLLSLAISVALIGSTAGFLLFNFPRARLFAGDAGAYVLGTAIALLAMLLISRNGAVSPWFAFTLVLYPFADTTAAIVRRIYRRRPISQADADHLHSLLARAPVAWRKSGLLGHLATPCIALVSLVYVWVATQFFQQTGLLMLLAVCYFVTYVSVYFWSKRVSVGVDAPDPRQSRSSDGTTRGPPGDLAAPKPSAKRS